MRDDGVGKLSRLLVAVVLVAAFGALDLALQPRLPSWVGDNSYYLLIVILAAEFIVIWRMVAGMSPRAT